MCYQSLTLVILLQRKPYFGWLTEKKKNEILQKNKSKTNPSKHLFPFIIIFWMK